MTQTNPPDGFPALESFDDISVREEETLQAYQEFLTERVNLPCDVVTSSEYEKYQLNEIEIPMTICSVCLGA